MSGAVGFDWQFVVVTLAALGGGWILLRPLWPSRGDKKAVGACGHCSSAACKTKEPAREASAGLVRIGSGASRKPKGSEGMQPGGHA